VRPLFYRPGPRRESGGAPSRSAPITDLADGSTARSGRVPTGIVKEGPDPVDPIGVSTTHRSRAAAACLIAGGLLSLAFVLHGAGVLLGPGMEPFFEKVVYNLALAAPAIAILVRRSPPSAERRAWIVLALAMLSWAAGNAVYALVLADRASIPTPSMADAGWLAFYPLAYVAIILLLRARVSGLRRGLWLDGIIGALAVGALCAAIVAESLIGQALSGSFSEVVTNMAYPIGDLVLLGVITFALTVTGWGASRTWALLAAGFLLFAVADSVYLWEVLHDRYENGEWIDGGWLLAGLLFGIAAMLPSPARRAGAGDGERLIVVPSVFGLIGLGLLVSGSISPLNRTALVLATLCMVAVIARMGLTFAQSVRESLTDVLTGLPNRRRLARDLGERTPAATPAHPLGIVFFDLNGFKRYNDAFGHQAGDALLVLLSRRLSAALAGHGTAYRMGGDEFCALVHGGSLSIEDVVSRALSALTETGDGFSIDAAHGLVVMPADETDPERALGLADQRMYALKEGGRLSTERETTDALLQVLSERDPRLGDHSDGVADLARATGRRLGIDVVEMEEIALAARLHDVGKAAVPDESLMKPGPLDADERLVMDRHPAIGERILRAAPSLAGVARIVRSSHEWFDGRGYPDGLAGEAIPIGSRIVAVCDAFDAIISARPYSVARTPQQALEELCRCAGTQFDPDVVDAFVAVLAERARRPESTALH